MCRVRTKSGMPEVPQESQVSVILGRRKVAAALTDAPELASRSAMVEAGGCELQPGWAGGMRALLPLTPEQSQAAGLRTSQGADRSRG